MPLRSCSAARWLFTLVAFVAWECHRVQSAQQTMQNINMQLNNLRQANGQKLALFGPHAQLRELVDRNRRAFDRVRICTAATYVPALIASACFTASALSCHTAGLQLLPSPRHSPAFANVRCLAGWRCMTYWEWVTEQGGAHYCSKCETGVISCMSHIKPWVAAFCCSLQVPIGPIGPHLTLQHTKWNRAAEVVLGGHLEKWIVHSARDLDVSQATIDSCSALHASRCSAAFLLACVCPAAETGHMLHGYNLPRLLLYLTCIFFCHMVVCLNAGQSSKPAYRTCTQSTGIKTCTTHGRSRRGTAHDMLAGLLDVSASSD